MYVVRDKKTKKILHINPAPLHQQLDGKDVYFKFDPEKMEIGKTNAITLPEHFHINDKNEIVEFSIKEKVDAGILKLEQKKKVVGDKIVEKTTTELVKEGLLSLEKIKEMRINSFSELSFAKRREILPDYKLQNAVLGIYDSDTLKNFKATVQAFRDEFFRIEKRIVAAKTLSEVESVTENFPSALVIIKKTKR